MTQRTRTEIAAVQAHIETLKQASWLGPARAWWPNYLFHCTDIRNAANILRTGELLSRVQATETDNLHVDIAAPGIIANTDTEWQDYVRLYFRPRTPTQYRNEGFRPKGQWEYGSHCPVPIYFLFDSLSVLSTAGSRFTDGNLAAGAIPQGNVEELRLMPFKSIYHDHRFGRDERDTIVYHRNAEVLIPQRLDLEPLRLIVCRSQAEYETLIFLLPQGTQDRWVNRIGVYPNLNLFHRKWTFVEQVEMNSQTLLFRFNKGTLTPGPFSALVEVFESLRAGPQTYSWESQEYKANDLLELGLDNLKTPQDYTVRLVLDDQLAFARRYQEDDLPF